MAVILHRIGETRLNRIAARAYDRCHHQTIGQAIRAKRKQLRLTQGAIAKLWDCSTSEVCRWEAGRLNRCEFSELRRRLNFLNLRIDDILPTEDAIERAVMEQVIAAVWKARGIPKSQWVQLLPLSEESFLFVRWICDNIPVPPLAKDDPAEFQIWCGQAVAFFENRDQADDRPRAPRSQSQRRSVIAAAGYWDTAQDFLTWLPLQIATVALLYHHLDDAEAAEPRFAKARQQARERCQSFLRYCAEEQDIREQMAYFHKWKHAYERPCFFLTLKLASLSRMRGRYWEALMHVQIALGTLTFNHNYWGKYWLWQEEGIAEFRKEMDELFAIHADELSDFYSNLDSDGQDNNKTLKREMLQDIHREFLDFESGFLQSQSNTE